MGVGRKRELEGDGEICVITSSTLYRLLEEEEEKWKEGSRERGEKGRIGGFKVTSEKTEGKKREAGRGTVSAAFQKTLQAFCNHKMLFLGCLAVAEL